MCRRLGCEYARHGVTHDARWDGLVHQSELLRLLCVDRFAAQHEVKRSGRADELWHALHAAPGGKNAQHDFWQTHARGGLVDRYAIAARHRELHAAAHAKSFDQRERRILHCSEALTQVVAALDEFFRGGDIV